MLRLVRNFSKVFTYTHEKIVTTCKDISTLPSEDLPAYFNKQGSMKDFFTSLPQKARSMQTYDISSISQSLSKFGSIHNFDPNFWPKIVEELCKRSKDIELNEIIDIVNIFSNVKTDPKAIKALYSTLCEEIEEFEFNDLKSLPFHKIEAILANYSLKNLGSGLFYELIAKVIMKHADFPKLAYQHLAKLAYYFSRAPAGKNKSSEFMKNVENTFWNAIHQGKLKDMEEITGLISYLIPGNIGSNDFRALLEFTLFRFLTNPKNQITISRLTQVVTAFTHYNITYKPLDFLLKQLVKDSLQNLSSKELVQILWAYCRHNKAELEFIQLLLKRATEIIPESKLAFRHFTFLMNAVINSGIEDPSLKEFIDNYSIKCLRNSKVQDHHLVKALSLLEDGPFLKEGMTSLLHENRLPSNHTKDLSRTFILVNENEKLQNLETIETLTNKLAESKDHMRSYHAARCAYSLARLNRGELKHYKLLEDSILKEPLEKLTPIDLGVACLGFGLIGMQKFCSKALSAVNDCFHKYQKKEYQNYSDTDEDESPANKLILVNEQDLDFTSEIPASAVVQMTWMAVLCGVEDPMFWTQKLVDKLTAVKKSDSIYRLNQWIWTAKTLREEEDFIVGVDSYHYALLQQVLSCIGRIREPDLSFQFVKNSSDFIADISRLLSKAKIDFKSNAYGIETEGKQIFLYENSHFVFRSSGYNKQIESKDLLGTVIMQKRALEKQGVQCIEIFRGEWAGLSESERIKKIEVMFKSG